VTTPNTSRRPSSAVTPTPVTTFDTEAAVEGDGFTDDLLADRLGVAVAMPVGAAPVVGATVGGGGVDALGSADEAGASPGASEPPAASPGVESAAAGGPFTDTVLKLSRMTRPATVATNTAMNRRMAFLELERFGVDVLARNADPP
jgi:hypothetical protein